MPGGNNNPNQNENLENQNGNPEVQNVPQPTPGYFAAKYKEVKANAAEARNRIPRPADDPKGFMEAGIASRKADRLSSAMNAIINALALPAEPIKAAMDAALGAEESQKTYEDTLRRQRYKDTFNDLIIRNHADVINTLPEDEKAAFDVKNKDTEKMFAIGNRLIEEGKLPKSVRDQAISRSLLFTIHGMDPEKRNAVIDNLAEKLTPEQALKFEQEMEAYQDPLDLEPEKMYTHPMGERINELKEQMPEAIRNNPDKAAEYETALNKANQFLSNVNEKVRAEYNDRENLGIQAIETPLNNKIYNENKSTFRDGKYNDMTEEKLVYGTFTGTADIVKPERTEDFKDLKQEKINLSDNTKEGFRKVFAKFDEMKLLDYPHDPSGEDKGKVYGFNKLLEEKKELKAAIQEGDPDKIIEATKKVEKTWNDHKELFEIANQYFSQDEAFIPGNMDSVRNDNVNFEFSGDLLHTAQINTVFLIYLNCKINKVSLEEYLENPAGNMMKSLLNENEKICFETVSQGLNFSDSMDLMLNMNGFKNAGDKVKADYGMGRAFSGPTVLESDPSIRNGNIVVSNEMTKFLEKTQNIQGMKFGYLTHTVHMDELRDQRDTTIRSLMLCADEDRNLNAMLGGLPQTDMLGMVTGEAFDPDKYMNEKVHDYQKIIERANLMEQKVSHIEAIDRAPHIRKGDVVYNKVVLYDQLIQNAPPERVNDPGLQQMKQEILHSLENFPAATSPQYAEKLGKVVENFKVREAPEVKASELVTRANEAKVGVHLGSKEYDNAVKAMEEVQKSLEEFQSLRGKDYLKQKDKIDEIRQKIEAADAAIDLYFDRKMRQNKMGDRADEKSKKRIAVMRDSKESLKQFNKSLDNFDIQAEKKLAADMNKKMKDVDHDALQNRSANMESEASKMEDGIDKTVLQQSAKALDNLYIIQSKNGLNNEQPLTPEDKAGVIHVMAQLTFREMLNSAHGPGIRANMNNNMHSYNKQVELIEKSPAFQKALPKEITHDTIRELGANPEAAKKIFNKMEKVISKQAEIEKDNNLKARHWPVTPSISLLGDLDGTSPFSAS